MTQENVNKFFRWLDRQLASRNMKYHKLSIHAGISHSAFSKAKAGHLPKWDACIAIASALAVDPLEVFRAASLLPDLPPPDAEFEQVRYQFYKLSPRSRRDAIRILRALCEYEDEERAKGNTI